jgi:hypothetical protein
MWNTDTTIAGRCFEDFVKSLFNPVDFSVFNRSDDWDPDFDIEYIRSGEIFSVECKYKSEMNNKVHWCDREHMFHYQDFSKKYNRPTFIVIGTGNKPCSPRRLFCIPLEFIGYCGLYVSFLEDYEHLPLNKPFFWKDRNLQ